jgi:hypothetical protein
MSKGLFRSRGRGSPASSPIIRQLVPLTNLAITTTGATGIGFGTAVIGDIPAGDILLLGAVAYLTVTKLSGDTIAAFTGSFSIGSAPTADATLSGAEIDLVPATTLSAATAGVSPTTRGAQPAQAMLNNVDGSLEINLNLLLDDASVSADAQAFTVSGYVQLAYVDMA